MRRATANALIRPVPVIYNSLTRSKTPLPSSTLITLYVCGPTVYDASHIGHGRTYTLFDAMTRVMRTLFNKEVVYAMNITDVDDKILNKSKATNRTRHSVSKQYENEFFEDMRLLGVERPTIVPRATEYIQEMVDFIGKLEKRGYAYKTKDGSVYVDTTKAKEAIGYPGSLGGGRDIASCTEESGHEKRNASDFALWKGSTRQEKCEDNWDASPAGGYGRPGWHLECSAMVDATLGRIQGEGRIDIHGGGIDLCFPHHTNERCQSQLLLHDEKKIGDKVTDEWATIFCHTGHVTVDQTKMSKSLGNFSTIRGVIESKQLSPRQLRLLFLYSSKYSSGLEWNSGSIERVKALDAQLDSALMPVTKSTSSSGEKETFSSNDLRLIHMLSESRRAIEERLADDFDFPGTFDELQKLAKEVLRRSTSLESTNRLDAQTRQFLSDILRILGFGGETGVQPGYGNAGVSETTTSLAGTGAVADSNAVLDELVKFRAKVRSAAKAGDLQGILQACDVLRNDNAFATIQDLKDGSSIWKRKH